MCDIFISLRYAEARDESFALKKALENRLPAFKIFVCDEAAGTNLMEVIVKNISSCRLAIVMGSRTYGQKTASAFSTFEELQYIKGKNKPMFLVKMCDEFASELADFALISTMYEQWKPSNQFEKENPPPGLVEKIVDKLRKETGFETGPPTPSAQDPPRSTPSAEMTASLSEELSSFLEELKISEELVAPALIQAGVQAIEHFDYTSEEQLIKDGMKTIHVRIIMQGLQARKEKEEADRKKQEAEKKKQEAERKKKEEAERKKAAEEAEKKRKAELKKKYPKAVLKASGASQESVNGYYKLVQDDANYKVYVKMAAGGSIFEPRTELRRRKFIPYEWTFGQDGKQAWYSHSSRKDTPPKSGWKADAGKKAPTIEFL
jgi:hypothetical protein